MPAPKPISKEMCLAAMDKTKSTKAAARYLGCSYQHLRKYMAMYKDEKTGKTLLELQNNQAGKGIPKHLSGKSKIFKMEDLLNGTLDPSSFSQEKIKYKLISEGYLEEECCSCGFNERRVVDYKVPLILHFKDKNKKNYQLDNISLYCYNCYFLYVGEVFNKKELKHIEDHTLLTEITPPKSEMELDPYHLKRLEELGLDDNIKDDNDPYTLVSYK